MLRVPGARTPGAPERCLLAMQKEFSEEVLRVKTAKYVKFTVIKKKKKKVEKAQVSPGQEGQSRETITLSHTK